MMKVVLFAALCVVCYKTCPGIFIKLILKLNFKVINY